MRSKIIRFVKVAVRVVVASLILQGCASVQPARQGTLSSFPNTQSTDLNQSAEAMGPPELYGPPPPNREVPFGPEPIQIKPVVLVLGPGLARGFAYVGVVRALNSERIPIAAIVGTEMGGFVGALYGMSSNLNQFEWALQRFKDGVFVKEQGFFQTKNRSLETPRDGAKFETQLKAVLAERDLKEARVPIKIVVQSRDTGIPFLVDEGNAVQSVRAAMGTPSLFEPTFLEIHGERVSVGAANSVRPFAVKEARELNLGPVIVVDVLTRKESIASEEELKRADLVIRPDIRNVGYLDFSKSVDIAYQGGKAVLKQLREIRNLVGGSLNP